MAGLATEPANEPVSVGGGGASGDGDVGGGRGVRPQSESVRGANVMLGLSKHTRLAAHEARKLAASPDDDDATMSTSVMKTRFGTSEMHTGRFDDTPLATSAATDFPRYSYEF